jgi:hypothetical protein
MSKRLHAKLQHSFARDDILDTVGHAANRVTVGDLCHCARIKVLGYAAVLAVTENEKKVGNLLTSSGPFFRCESFNLLRQ